jgi:hypothetical protein
MGGFYIACYINVFFFIKKVKKKTSLFFFYTKFVKRGNLIGFKTYEYSYTKTCDLYVFSYN